MIKNNNKTRNKDVNRLISYYYLGLGVINFEINKIWV